MSNSYRISDIFRLIWKNLLIIIGAMLVFGLLFGGYAKYKQSTEYTAKREITIYHNYTDKKALENTDNGSTSLASDMQMMETYAKVSDDTSIAKQAKKIIKKNYGYKMSASDIKSMLDITSDLQTVVLNVSAKSGSSDKAVAVANSTAIAIKDRLPKMLNDVGTINVMSAANKDTTHSTTGPSAKKYGLLGIAIGFLAAFIWIFWRETIKLDNDNEKEK